MLRFAIRIALYFVILAFALPAVGLATVTSGLLPVLGVAAIAGLVAAILNTGAGFLGVAAVGASGLTIAKLRAADLIVNKVGSFLVHLLSLKLATLVLAAYFALSGAWALVLGAVLLTVVCYFTGGEPMKVTITVTRTTSFSSTFRRR